jgi:hypothetical protein
MEGEWAGGVKAVELLPHPAHFAGKNPVSGSKVYDFAGISSRSDVPYQPIAGNIF